MFGHVKYLHYVRLDEVHTCVLSKRIANTPWICHNTDSIFSVKNILAIYAQTQPTNLSASHITEQVTARATEYWQKKLANCCDSPNSPKFFPLQSFLLYGMKLLATNSTGSIGYYLCLFMQTKFQLGNYIHACTNETHSLTNQPHK